MVNDTLNNNILNREDVDKAYNILHDNPKALFREKIYAIKKFCNREIKCTSPEEIKYFRRMDDVLRWGYGNFLLPPLKKKPEWNQIIINRLIQKTNEKY